MASNTDFSILARVVLDVSDIQKQLSAVSKNIKFNIDSSSVSAASGAVGQLGNDVNNTSQAVAQAEDSWYKYYVVLKMVENAVTSMAEQTYELDSAITELKKVTDLQGESLDKYVQGLAKSGKDVARTGKPNRSEPE